MIVSQAIQRPYGVTVFGSSIIRVSPDVVSIQFSVTRTEEHPKDAFQKARETAQAVRQYLSQSKFEDVGSSQINLTEDRRYIQGEDRFLGYRAWMEFHVLLHDMGRLEEILMGIVDAGVNRIGSVDFQTTRLKELRAQVRVQAIEAAREKAELYCQAAGVQLGKVLHIEDVNPERLGNREGHSTREVQSDEGEMKAFDPASIVVGGAVQVAFGIEG